MSFFDVFPFQSHQFFKKYDDFTPEDLEKSIFYGVFSVKTGNSTGFKNKFLNVLNHKMTITSKKAKIPKYYIDLKELYSLKNRPSDNNYNSNHKYGLSLFKNNSFFTIATPEIKLHKNLTNILRKYCILDDFSDDFKLLDLLENEQWYQKYETINKNTLKKFTSHVFDKNHIEMQHRKKYLKKEIEIRKFLPSSPYLFELYEVYESPFNIFMITEYIKEKSLYNYLKIAAKISEEAAFEIFIQIFKGLIFLNSNGICHRDIKSENIFFVNETNIKIADFSVIDYEKKGLCGTPGYMAPEIFKNETYDEKVDVFSLGVVLYSMVAGCSLFRGKTAEEILKKNEACKNIKKKKKLNNLSRNRKNYLLLIIQNFIVRNLLYKMLEKSPTKRIELRDIFMSKWVKKKGCLTNTFEKKKCFLNKNESEPILLIHKNSASEDFSKMKQTKISWFKKTYEDNSNALFFDIEDRKIKFSNNNVTPKFFSHINNNNEDKINDYSDKTGDNDQKFSNDLQKDTSSIAYYPKSEILSDNSIESDSFSFKNESKALLKTKKKQNEELINNLTKDNIEAISTLRTRRAYDIDLPQMMQKMKQTDFKWKKF